MSDLQSLAETAKAWPFEQARALLKRLRNMEKQGKPKQGPIVFETGYGPSGLPHIGTFGEVVRTTMVKTAFEALTGGDYETKLICISDDMDGMRKVPPTVPNPESLEEYLQKPLTDVPDPFGTHDSYGAHMGARLCAFLDSFGFEYEFLSATDCYKNGTFDPMLLAGLEKFDEIMGGDAADPRRRASGDLFAFLANLAKHRPGALCADEGDRSQKPGLSRSRMKTAPMSRWK